MQTQKDAPGSPGGGAQAAGNIESRVDALDKAMTEIKGMLKQLVAEEGSAQPKQSEVEQKSAQLQKHLDETMNEKAKLQKELALQRQGTGAAQHDNTAATGDALAKAFDDVAEGAMTGTQFRKALEKKAHK
jgi:peptidoglycan hydrolase CwlO-like protein